MFNIKKFIISIFVIFLLNNSVYSAESTEGPQSDGSDDSSYLIAKNSNYKKWSFDNDFDNIIKMESKRIDGVPGTHTLKYSSDIDSIEIKHIANNRIGFALGAVIAAEWILNKEGVFSMKDVINDFKF